METNVCPKTWLVESILATIFCCLPFGIVGIVNASKVSSLYEQGRYDAAREASSSAGTWTRVAFYIGLACIAFNILFGVIWGFSIFSLLGF